MLLVLIGTRAQLVKMAPVIQQLQRNNIPFRFVLTGQHKETMDDLVDCFGIKQPDLILVENTESDSHFKLLNWLLKATISVVGQSGLDRKNIQAVIVHGDTLSTLFGALFGYLKKIPVVHVEAGLRSFNKLDPFPEEIIRLCVSKLTSVHYCPGDWACQNLKNACGEVVNTEANTLMDATFFAIEQQQKKNQQENYAVVSIHRNENLNQGNRFVELIEMMNQLSKIVELKFVLHPVTRSKLEKTGLMEKLLNNDRVQLLDRMEYIEFIQLLNGARVLLTDGGSNQEETYYLNIPCVLLRHHTERQEGLGDNVLLSGLDYEKIEAYVRQSLENTNRKIVTRHDASQKIVQHLQDYFQLAEEPLS